MIAALRRWVRRRLELYGHFAPPVARVKAEEWAQARRARQLRPFFVESKDLFTHGIDP